MSEQEVTQDVKTEAIAQDVKTEAVNSNDTADDYSVPGYRFKKVNESNKNLEAENMELKSKIKDREIAEAEQKEEYKNLYEEAKADRNKG